VRIAHISDLHVLDLTGVTWRRFMNKRLTGAVNLLSFRNNAHPPEMLTALVDHLIERCYDHIVLTGDVSNLALESEFARARADLERLGGPERLTIVPGNHDTYTLGAVRQRRFAQWFGPWMGAEDGVVAFPFVKTLGSATVFGLDSTYWTMPLMSFGRVDGAQKRRLAEHFRRADVRDTFKIVALHHNMHVRGRLNEATGRLRGRKHLGEVLAAGAVDLVLHGHSHRANRYYLEQAGQRIPVIGCGSSTWTLQQHMARYNVYTIEGGQLTDIHCHVYDADAARFQNVPVPLTVA
jgi:3',5'-cyclic AMP phosphodiesterase CpdA